MLIASTSAARTRNNSGVFLIDTVLLLVPDKAVAIDLVELEVIIVVASAGFVLLVEVPVLLVMIGVAKSD